jgi:ABC-type lipoprotein release transport system permease subunit
MILCGLIIGMIGLISRVSSLRSFLYDISPRGLRRWGMAVLFVILTGVCATIIPAYRAVRIDPVDMLREN